MSKLRIINKVSKSNGLEVLAVLYFIAASLCQVHWLSYVLYFFAAENLVESIVFSAYFSRRDRESS